jgi:AAA15 family ATPase/GTPase
MSEHFIKNIEIRNFKCFEDFKAEGFGRVNLIGGKNNVGKTAFMEAVYLSTSKEIFEIYTHLLVTQTHRNAISLITGRSNPNDDLAKRIRENINFMFKTNHGKTSIGILNDKYEIKLQNKSDSIKKSFQELYNLIQIQPYGNSQYSTSQNFISSYFMMDGMLALMIDELKLNNKYETLNKYFGSFFDIQKIDIINGMIYLQKDNQFRPIYEYGHGMKTILNIILPLLFSHKNKSIFIDEIENGIHYSLFDELWKIILDISKEKNLQVFATTHSKECIESYARVAKRLEDEEIIFIELGREDNKITSIIYEYDEIINQVEQHQDIRGW